MPEPQQSDYVMETLGYIRATLDELRLDVKTHLEHDERVHAAHSARLQALEVENLKRATVSVVTGKWVHAVWAIIAFGLGTFARLVPWNWH